MQLPDPAEDHELAGHEVQAVEPAVLKVLTVHVVQAVAFPLANEPAAQVVHAVEVPSTKYCPGTQHTAVPEGAQCTVPPGHAMVHGAGTNVYSSTLPP